MSQLDKIVWSEGTLLGQQHFQKWSDYLDKKSVIYNHTLCPYHWGWVHIDIEESLLEFNQLLIKSFSLILSNGEIVQFNEQYDQQQLCISLEINEAEIFIYLCIPHNNEITGLTGYDDSKIAHSAWSTVYQEVSDVYDPDRKQELGIAKRNFWLEQSTTNLNKKGYIEKIVICQLELNRDKKYQLKSQFTPCILSCSANFFYSMWVASELESIKASMHLLEKHSVELKMKGQSGQDNLYMTLSLMHSFYQYYVDLKNFDQKLSIHPQYIYQALANLIVSMLVYSEKEDIDAMPIYQHHDQYNVLKKLTDTRQSILNELLPNDIVGLNLEKNTDHQFSAKNIDLDILHNATLFILVKNLSGKQDWITRFSKETKVASNKDLLTIVKLSLPGIPIKHVERVPTKLIIKPGYEYFVIDKNNALWLDVISSKTIGMYISQEFKDIELKIISLKEEDLKGE